MHQIVHIIRRWGLPALCALLTLTKAWAQESEINPNNENRIFDDEIHSVQLHPAGAPLLLPIINLQVKQNALQLEFDHLGPDIKDYSYTLRHCNSDWQPSELDEHEYIDGFTEDRITTIHNSLNTLMQYTHYSLGLPSANMRWTRSGNYLLKIYDKDNDDALVLVRRFCVIEPFWVLEAKFQSAAMASKYDTHHEIDFSINTKDIRVPVPKTDINAFVLQNGRWDNAIGPLQPAFLRGNQLVFDFQDKIIFPAGKEWRYFDIRTFDFKGDNVKAIRQMDRYYEVTLRPDKSRAGHPYQYNGDINGRFSIENRNINQVVLQCEYAKVLFNIERPLPEEDADVYVFGELTDWQLKPEFKMDYNHAAKAYYCEAMLKQGYYNYEYVVVDRETGKADENGFEGNSHQTYNVYTILVYFRTFGDRYERLMGMTSIDSRDWRQ